MSEYKENWDLTTIPKEKWDSEHGRRQRAKAPAATNIVLKPCKQCGNPLNSTQRRKPCPECGFTHPRTSKS